MQLKLSDLTQGLRFEKLNDFSADPLIHGVSINSRTVKAGDLFVAIQGLNFDGHEFVNAAIEQGAAAVVVQHAKTYTVPTLQVADTATALGELAHLYRMRFTIPVIGITGSCGKTTVKEMVASILKQQGNVAVSQGNQNNTLGVPLTLLQITAEDHYAVVEMGTNQPGEIAMSSSWACPTISVITNIAPAHLAGLGDVKGVFKEKSQIYVALPPTGIGVYCGDSVHANDWQALLHNKRSLSFGSSACEVYAEAIHLADESGTFTLRSPRGAIEILLSIPGQHHVMNAVTAATVALALDCSLLQIKKGLETFEAVPGRFNLTRGIQGIRLIDDSYNANMASVKAAIEQLARYQDKRILVFGDMGELGEQAAYYHEKVGCVALDLGIDQIYTVGELSAQYTAKAYGARAKSYPNIPALLADLIPSLTKECTVLVKGSFAMGMSKIVDALSVRAI